jgi:hypothetical protein
MDLAGYVINAVVVEGRSVREVASAHDPDHLRRAASTGWARLAKSTPRGGGRGWPSTYGAR